MLRKDGTESEIKLNIDLGDGTTMKQRTLTGIAKGLGMALTREQRGPNGGRIMWFPPYNLKFSEQTRANWNSNEFIGRGEKVYSYVNSERTGTLSFTILVDHPSVINEWARGGKMGKTANKVDPLSKDEMILRYFAGCDALEFNPRKEYDVPYTIIDTEWTNTETHEEKVKTGTHKKEKEPLKQEDSKDKEAITFYSVFYFPNDYSARDFMADSGKTGKSGGAVAGLNEMFERGDRSNGTVGYELGRGGTGMTYGGSYYYKCQKNKQGFTREWYYPVDNRVSDEELMNPLRYKDTQDFGLNAGFYGDFFGDDIPEGEELVNYLNEGNKGPLGTGGDLALAKQLVKIPADVEDKYFIPAYNFYKNLSSVITKLDAITNMKYRYEIDVQGFASKHGNTESNKILADDRAQVIASWLRGLGVFQFGSRDSLSANGNGEIYEANAQSESDFKPKAGRAAVVTFKIFPTETVITEVQQFADVDDYENRTVTTTKVETDHFEEYITDDSTKYENQTYDNEYTYFKQINENDDMVKRYISDKVDYFDPAFHSITPEGFNARLTFLHQCTRQGPTISASDLGMGSAYGAGNLSFGRAPFCILRIGDFFNTKICIESVNIEYDNGGGVQWDLNPEGVGLQPMYANVTLNFTFLGGSDIAGPVARLQNAASFNYYANTSVYDRRSDYRDTFVDEKDDKFKSWSPVILNKNEKANITEHWDFYTRTPRPGQDETKQ